MGMSNCATSVAWIGSYKCSCLYSLSPGAKGGFCDPGPWPSQALVARVADALSAGAQPDGCGKQPTRTIPWNVHRFS